MRLALICVIYEVNVPGTAQNIRGFTEIVCAVLGACLSLTRYEMSLRVVHCPLHDTRKLNQRHWSRRGNEA